MQGRDMLRAVAAGVGAAVLASALTWWYLWSITIDDGLEGLVFLPLLGAACAVVSVPPGWRHTSIASPTTVAGVAVLTATVVLAARGASRGGPPVASTAVVAVAVLGPLALSGAIVGWAFGDQIERFVHRRRTADVPEEPVESGTPTEPV